MAPQLRVNISIPSDFYEECLKYCRDNKTSFSQLVRTALINQIKGEPSLSGIDEQVIIEIVKNTVNDQINKLQSRVENLEKKFDKITDD